MKRATTTIKTNGAQLWQESARKPFTQQDTLPDNHDSAANVTNPAFHSNCCGRWPNYMDKYVRTGTSAL